MTSTKWLLPADPTDYVKKILAMEANDIPEEKINAGKWVLEELAIDEITVNQEMIDQHNADELHIKRRDGFINAIEREDAIPPLIVLGRELYLVDGYARYRALKKLGIKSIEVIMQDFSL